METLQQRGARTVAIREDVVSSALECAFQVHRILGPGLLGQVYELCLAYELEQAGMAVQRQSVWPVTYKGKKIETAFRLDLVVEDHLIIELKSIERTLPLHAAQIQTYLRFTDFPVGLLLNFNTKLLRQGVRRFMPPRRP